MVRLILHGSNGSSIQFGTRDGGMSITGNSEQVEFQAGGEPLLTIERDGEATPVPTGGLPPAQEQGAE